MQLLAHDHEYHHVRLGVFGALKSADRKDEPKELRDVQQRNKTVMEY